jgi:hypothetical protein
MEFLFALIESDNLAAVVRVPLGLRSTQKIDIAVRAA